MSLDTREGEPTTYLRKLAELYINGAIETFAKHFASIELKTELRISFSFNDATWLAAACHTQLGDGFEELILDISETCLEAFSADIDINNDDENPILDWRFCWLIFHEIAHWLYGHIPYYKQEGWIADLGLCETVSFSPDAIGSNGRSDILKQKAQHLAQAAELQADAFATIELFNLINQIPPDKETPASLVLDIQCCYFCIITTICSFYKDSGRAEGGPFHPSWNVRCLNVLLTLFRAYSRHRGLEGGPNLTYENHVVAAVVAEFIDEAILPTVDGIEEYAEALGLGHLVHDRAQDGLYDPLDFIRLLNGEFDKESLAHTLSDYLDLVDQLNVATAPLRSAVNFEPHSASVQPGKLQTHFRFQILCNLQRAEIEIVIDEWRDQMKLSELETSFTPYTGTLNAKEIIDIRFRVGEPMTQKQAQDLVRQLIASSEKRSGLGQLEK